MPDDREKRIAERAEEIRRQEGDPRGIDSDPAASGADSEAVEANTAMDAAFAGERKPQDKAELAVEQAAAGARLKSTDLVKEAEHANEGPAPADDEGGEPQ